MAAGRLRRRSTGSVVISLAVGAVVGVLSVTLIWVLHVIDLMPFDWVIGAWTGAATLGLLAALTRIGELSRENALLRTGARGARRGSSRPA
ncbi:MAG: hypothetical protein ACRDYD_08755 [Acidimicrobiales bacterium]